jgi:hypothetical protein
VVSITEDMMGGEWEQATRHLRVSAGPWIQPRDMTYYLGQLDKYAKRVDDLETQGRLIELDQGIKKLEKAVRQYAYDLARFEKQVADYVAAVHQARTLAKGRPDPKSAEELEEERRAEVLAQSEIGLDRLGALYDIPKPRNYRTGR